MDARQPHAVDIRLISFEVPMSIQRRVGAAIIAFSRFEHQAELTIWHLLNLDGDPAKLVTGKLDTSRKLQLLKELLQLAKFSHPFWERFWMAERLCVELRNKIAHGVWIMYDAQPCIVSAKLRTEPNSLFVEGIPEHRLRALESLSGKLDAALRLWGEQLGAQNAKWSTPQDVQRGG